MGHADQVEARPAGGPDLLAACETLGGCAIGEAKITRGYRLTAKHVIHAVGPVWSGGDRCDEDLVASWYRRAVEQNDIRCAFWMQLELGLNVEAFNALTRRDHVRSEAHMRRVLEIALSPELESEPRYRLYGHWQLGMIAACRGDFDEAFSHLEHAERIERDLHVHNELVMIEIGIVRRAGVAAAPSPWNTS